MRKKIFKIIFSRASAAISILGESKWIVFVVFSVLAGILLQPWFPVPAKGEIPERVIEGIVIDEDGTVSGAVVRIQTTEHSTVSGPNGEFKLAVPYPLNGTVKLTAWAKGYFISGPVDALPGENGVTISLHRHGKWDNPEYEWLPSIASEDSDKNQGCAECHLRDDSATNTPLPVDEWLLDAHSQSAANPIFLALYYGTDSSGRRSQSTRYRYTPDNTLHKLPPDPQEPWYGPGYRLDNPNTPGNCGACHLAAAAVNSPYSDEKTGKTCQDCHMQGSGAEFFAHPDKGGLKRDPDTLAGHRMPGARDLDLLQNSVSLTLEAERTTEGLRVRTKVINDQTGHHVPTDTPLRHVILVVRAYDSGASELPLKKGAVLPEWCGAGDPNDGNYAGLPGKVYVKLLEEKWSGDSPTAAYWNPTRVLMDTRIGAFESDAGEFLFDAPDSGEARVKAVLIYRRIYKKIMELKGLNEPDIIMESAEISIS